MYVYVWMFRRQEYSERVAKTLNFESRIYSDFEKLCAEEHVYPSHKIQQLMVEALRKKVKGDNGIHEPNPLNLSYISYLKKPVEKPLQLSLDEFRTRERAFSRAREMDREVAQQLYPIAKNCLLAHRFVIHRIAADDVRIVW